MINVNDIKLFFEDLARKNQTTGYVTASRFNRLAPFVQTQIIRELRRSKGQDFYSIDSLSELRAQKNVTITDGVFSKPDDYLFFDEGFVISYGKNLDQEFQQDIKPLDLLDTSEYATRKSSRFEPPTKRRPIARELASSFEVYPTPFRLELNYLKKPDAPFWNFSVSSGVQVYAESSGGSLTNPNNSGSGSTNFTLPEFLMPNVIYRMASILGIEVRQQDLIQAGLQLQNS
jgi:hypothetical protein